MREKVYDEDMEEEIDVFDLEVSALMRPCANKRYLCVSGCYPVMERHSR